MTIEELEFKVIDWALERGIFEDPNPMSQALKTLEECNEMLVAIHKDDDLEIKDAIGDQIVTLILQAKMQGLSLKECLGYSYCEIKDRKGKMINGTFVKEN